MSSNYLCLGIFLVTIHTAVSTLTPEGAKVCQKESGFDQKITDLDFNDPSFPKEGKCYLACLLKQTSVLKEDGTLDKDKATATLEAFLKDDKKKSMAAKFVAECAAEVKTHSDICETAFEYVKCKKSKVGEE